MKRFIRGYLPTMNGCGMLIIGKLEISYTLPYCNYDKNNHYIEVGNFHIRWEVR